MAPFVYVVVLNWRGWQDTLECIGSLLKSDYPNLKVVVVDNASGDESVTRIRESYPEVTLLESALNLGFSGGNNVGIRHALDNGADYVFVLNNDTTVASVCISRLIEFGQVNPDAGLMGPKIYDMGTTHYRQWSVKNRLNLWSIIWTLSPFRRLVYNSPFFESFFYTGNSATPVYGIPGSAMMFKAAAIRDIGLFDEETFLYWEEFIVAEKFRALGIRTYVVPEAVIWHQESATISKIGARKFIENVKSERYFFRKYLKLAPFEVAVLNFIRLVGYLGRAVSQPDYRSSLAQFISVFFKA